MISSPNDAPMHIFFALLLTTCGLTFGSFFTLAGVRIAKGESLFSPPPHCDACGRRLSTFELVPVFSWLFLRARCRTCTVGISAAYPAVEASTGLLFGLYWWMFGATPDFWVAVFATSVLAILSAADFSCHRLPDVVLLPSIGVLLVVRFFYHPFGLASYLTGALAGFTVLLAIRLFSHGGMGLGDVKLFVFVGLFTGLAGTVLTLMLSSLVGSLSGVVLLARGRLKRRHRIPFGPAVAISSLLVYGFSGPYIAAYLSLF